MYRRGRGSSIQEQTVGNNVGKLPWAAGTGYNLQGLSKRGQKPKEERCRFRFQSGTGGVREINALREISPAALSVSIETGSTFFRFQLGLIDRLIDYDERMPRLLDDPNDPRWLEAERRDIFLRGLLRRTTGRPRERLSRRGLAVGSRKEQIADEDVESWKPALGREAVLA